MCGPGSRYKNNNSVFCTVFRARAVFSVIHVYLDEIQDWMITKLKSKQIKGSENTVVTTDEWKNCRHTTSNQQKEEK